MTLDCDQLRRRALEHGDGSPEYAVWARHSLRCPTCRNELYVQELLRSDGRTMRGALSSESVSRLVQLAETRYRGGAQRRRRMAARLWSWCWRGAGVAALVYAMAMLSPDSLRHDDDVFEEMPSRRLEMASAVLPKAPGGSPEQASADGGLLASSLAAGASDDVHAAQAEHDGAGAMLVTGRDLDSELDALDAWEMETAIQDCRKRIDFRREQLFERLENDAGGRP